MVAGPELTRIVSEFESNLPTNCGKNAVTTHHEHNCSHQQRFHNHVNSLFAKIDKFCNPFADETSKQMIVLDTKEVLDQAVSETVECIESIGQAKFSEFHETRIIKKNKSVDDVISRNKLPLCNRPKLKSKQTNNVATMKTALFKYITNLRSVS